jgi:hypothetical protein
MSLVQWVKLLARYRICGLYTPYNGILACHLCHKMFHFRLLTIIPEGVESAVPSAVHRWCLEGSALCIQGPRIPHTLAAPRDIYAEARAPRAEGARQRDRKQKL